MNVKALTENDKGLLVGKPVAPRPRSKHVGLSLTWLDVEISINVRLKSWGVSEWYECIGYDASNKGVEIEAEVEVDI